MSPAPLAGWAEPVDLLLDAVGRSDLVDLTHPLVAGMPVWPGHPEFCQTAMASLDRGDASCYHALALGEHTGTHFDAPSHFVRGGLSIAQAPLRSFFGRLITIPAPDVGRRGVLGPCRILDWEAAALLVERGVSVVGSDCLSIDAFGSPDYPAHLILLSAGILIGENFARLGDLPPVCWMAALPLPIVDGSGSPLRAIAVVPNPRQA